MGKTEFDNYIRLMRNPRISKPYLVADILSAFTFEELKSFKKRVPGIFHGMLKMPNLKKRKFEDIFVVGNILKKDVADIFGSLAFIIIENADSINRYLELKKRLDFATAIARYDEAYSLLDKIEKEVSASMSGTYYKLKLIRLEKGITEATNFYNDIYKRNSVLSLITNFVFKTSHIDIPLEIEVDRIYRMIPEESENSDFLKGLAFPYKHIKGDIWMRLILATSLIDLYECFVDHLTRLPKEKIKGNNIRNIVRELAGTINDERLKRLDSLINIGKPTTTISDTTEERQMIEDYYSGNYGNVIKKAPEYLKNNPLEPSIIDVYYKSCVKTGHSPDDLFTPDSLASRLHHFYYMSISDQPISEAFGMMLRSLAIAWYPMPQMKYIYHTFKDMDKKEGISIYDNFWRHSRIPELRDALFFDSPDEATEYLRNTGYQARDSASIDIIDGKITDFYNQSLHLLYDFKDNEVDDYLKEIEQEEPAPSLLGRIISRIFMRLLELKRNPEAITLYVRFSLKNPNIKIDIDKSMISKVLTDPVDATIPDQLALSVFYTMIGADVFKRYLAYKRFLKSLGIKRASEIRNPDSPELQYFLGKSVDRNVLNLHVLMFETEDDVARERIELCKRMLKATGDKAYSEEITSLIKEQEVKTLSQHVNDSKIHVDVQSLINSGLPEARLWFKTYREIDDNLEIYEQKGIEGILDFIRKQDMADISTESSALPSEKYKKILFRQMFLYIRDRFLFDPVFGLDKYLSARIRHGTLLTQLRNHFLSHSLVTNKKEGGNYERVSPWTLRKDAVISDIAKEAINDRMMDFTKWLDGRLQTIKDEYIQIKTERNDATANGLFDYSYGLMEGMIDELEDKNFESFETFIHQAIELLWKWTDSVLRNVRQYFTEYEKDVVHKMAILQKDVVKLMKDFPSLTRKFKDEVTACRTAFQNDVAIVSGWFKPEKSNVKCFTIQQAVDTSLAVINKINQDALSFQNIDIDDNNIYNGRHFNAIHDIFHDMMNNILAYEENRDSCKGKGEIKICGTDGHLSIEVSNPVEERDIPRLLHIIEGQKDIPSLIANGNTRRENNSGCIKIFSTVMYTLGSDNRYENLIVDDRFKAKIEINTKNMIYHEDSDSGR